MKHYTLHIENIIHLTRMLNIVNDISLSNVHTNKILFLIRLLYNKINGTWW